MASLQTLERRILALEARLADVEGGYGDTLYKLHRASIKADLRTAKILQHLDIDDVSDPNPRVVRATWPWRCDRCPVTWDDVVVEANIVGVWRTPIGWAVYGVVGVGGGGCGSARRIRC
jgi:hypothetical protein